MMSNDDNRFNRAFYVGPRRVSPEKAVFTKNTSKATGCIRRRVTLQESELSSPNELHQSGREPIVLRHT